MLQMLLKSVYIQLHSFFIWCMIVLKLFPITLIYHYISVVYIITMIFENLHFILVKKI